MLSSELSQKPDDETHSGTKQSVGLVFVFFAARASSFTAHVDALFQYLADVTFRSIPWPILYIIQ